MKKKTFAELVFECEEEMETNGMTEKFHLLRNTYYNRLMTNAKKRKHEKIRRTEEKS